MVIHRQNWALVSKYVGTRTEKQCFSHYRYLITKQNKSKGKNATKTPQYYTEKKRWSETEKKLYAQAVLELGNDWNKVAEFVGTKTAR